MDKLKIVIIEDDVDVLDFIKVGIDKLGIDIDMEMIKDGDEFTSKYENFNADLVILDLMMPKITGFQICSYLRQNLKIKKLKILAITGYDTPENKSKILAMGADEYLAKPFDLDSLIEKLQTLIKAN
ncbi:MAG: response regulator [bacterium]